MLNVTKTACHAGSYDEIGIYPLFNVCGLNEMSINCTKRNVMHFRPEYTICDFRCTCGNILNSWLFVSQPS